jgi:hypothetical protein
MKPGFLTIAVGGFLASRSAPSATGAPSVLVCDKDTVAGVTAAAWSVKGAWLDPEFIRIRNTSAHAVTLDSLSETRDSIGTPGSARTLELVFAVRTHAPGNPVTGYATIFGYGPILVPAGDSIDVGLFQIGTIFVPMKASAGAGPRRYLPGDSIYEPLAFYAGGDSIGFTLKATVRDIEYGTDGIRIRVGRRPTRLGKRTFTLDGRSVSTSRPGARILFR